MLYFDFKTAQFHVQVPNDCEKVDYLHGYYEALEDVHKIIKSKPNNLERLEIVTRFVKQIIGEDEQK